MAQPDWQNLIIGLLGGGVLASVVTHSLVINRESRDRRHEFRGLLGRWLGAIRQDADIAKTYTEFVGHLWGYYGKCHRDFFRKRRFKALCDDIGCLKPEDIQKDANSYREIIARKIEALIDFV
jgi:hypothetical protein